jgi:S-formylglutathione hydrolase FrmB
MARVVVAIPDFFTKLYGNQYINSVGTGRYADYLCDEIVPFVEEAFNCGGEGRRGLFGKSSGGYGAAWHGLWRADFWAAIAVNSGDMGFDTIYLPSLIVDCDILAAHDYSIERYMRHVESKPKIADKDILCIVDLAQGAFYDPDLTQFRAMRLPLDPYTGEIIPDRWDNWMAYDPVVMLDERLQEIRKLKAIWMDCGNRDQYRIHFGMRRFHKKLKAAGVDHVYEEFDDTHSDVDYRMDKFLPFLADKLST